MRKAFSAIALVAAVSASPTAHAQFPMHRKPPPSNGQQIDCAAIATMPNAPMSFEACQQMMGAAASMQNSMNDPAGMRPGDDDMTCDQIRAELMTQQGITPNREHVREAQVAAKDFQAKSAQIQAEGAALAAQQAAVATGASALSLVPGVGDVAARAVMASQAAQQQAFGAHATAVLNPAENRVMNTTGSVVSDMAQSLQNNPRFARLGSLAMKKNCRG
jgi:hypothetical protein